jgi:hypothetical protein
MMGVNEMKTHFTASVITPPPRARGGPAPETDPHERTRTSEAGMFQVAELLLECPGMTFLFVGLSLEFAADLVLSLFVLVKQVELS